MIDVSGIEIKTNADKVMNAIKNLELMILEEADRICRKNNIEYSISGGTMLGAVRHGGFIPWDDDIDIEFAAKNYERFIEACKKDLDTDRFTLLTHETCPEFNDFPAKILLKNTMCRSKSAKQANLPLTICVDLFKLDHMPDDFEERKKIAHKLFNMRQCMFCKTYGNVSFLINPDDRVGENLFNIKYVPRSVLYRKIKKLEAKCNKKYANSGRLYDNCIYHVGYYGIPDLDSDGYEDVKFEHLTVRKYRDHHAYLSSLFGDDYMEMPPVEKRATHHAYIEFDLGDYAKQYDLPDDYDKYMKNYLNGERLIHIKNLCLDMLDEVDRICRENDITYYLSGDDVLYKANGIEEMCKMWRKGVCILMDRENLKKFNAIAAEKLDPKYFYQTQETDPEYIFSYPKIRLNGTYMRDRSLIPAKINEGLWLNIGMLVNAPNDKKEAEKYYNDLRQVYDDVRYKCLYDEIRTHNLKDMKGLDKDQIEKRKAMLARIEEIKGIDLDTILKRRDAVLTRYEHEETDYWVDSTTNVLKAFQFRKSDFGEGKRDTLLGREYTFPVNPEGLSDSVTEMIPQRAKKYEKLRTIKETDPERYQKATEQGAKGFMQKFNKKFTAFNLGLYDLEDYQLSVLRFDENE